MIAVLLGLTSALVYGASDFLGGTASRRSSIAGVVVVSHLVALAVTLLALPLVPPGAAAPAALAWGAGAGVANAVGVVYLYRGLSRGRMAVVSPLTGVVAAVVPLLFGLAVGERPGTLPLAGVAVALVAIVLVTATAPRPVGATIRSGAAAPGPAARARDTSGPAARARDTSGPAARARDTSGPAGQDRRGDADVLDGLVAGLAYGVFFVLLGGAGGDAAVWPVVGVQAATAAVLVPAALLGGRSVLVRRPDLAATAGAGVLAAMAHVAFVVAAGRGLLSLVAVLAALYPAATVVLARVVLGERWSRSQVAGLLLAAVGVAAIATG